MNKIVVTALSANGATAVASVSGNLVKAVNSLTTPLSVLLAILGILGIALALWSVKKMMKKRDVTENSSFTNSTNNIPDLGSR